MILCKLDHGDDNDGSDDDNDADDDLDDGDAGNHNINANCEYDRKPPSYASSKLCPPAH